MNSTSSPPTLLPNYPCLICKSPKVTNLFCDKSLKEIKGWCDSDISISPSLKNFILTTILEISPTYLNTREFSDTWLNICEFCLFAVKEAEKIHNEIQVATHKFRKCQESIVKVLRENSTVGQLGGPNHPYELCRQFAKQHDFNGFGFPFIVENPNRPNSQQIKRPAPTLPPSPIVGYFAPSPHKKNSTDSQSLSSPSPVIPIRKKMTITRGLFLNIAALTDLFFTSGILSKTIEPFVSIAKVSLNELPTKFDFEKNILRLIDGRKVYLQTRDKQVLCGYHDLWKMEMTGGKHPNSHIYYMSDLHTKEEMAIVGQSFQKWKEVGGVLSYMYPQLNCISNLAFIFSEKDTCLGLHMEDLRFSSANILFQGKKQWDIVNPDDNDNLISHLKDKYSREYLDEKENGCAWWPIHKRVLIGKKEKKLFRVVSVTQGVGDVVAVPSGVLHQVTSLEDCVAGAYNFVDLIWCQEGKYFDCCSCKHKDKKPILKLDDVNRLKEAHFQLSLYAKFQANNGSIPDQSLYCAKETAKFFDKLGAMKD